MYDALSDQLDDHFTVFHRANWLAKPDGSEPQDGEVDFALAHPDLGVLVMEVKGGNIRHDGAANLWFSRDRSGAEHAIKDPFDQVRREMYGLRSVLERVPAWPTWDVRFTRAVAFPDVEYRRALTSDGPPDIVIDADDLSSLGSRVSSIFRWWSFSGDAAADGGGLGAQGMQVLTDMLARSFTLRTPLAVDIAADEAEVVRLSEEQFRLLDFLRLHRRALVTGVAGAGKTVLAAEHARRLARQGMDVALLCVDEPLARRFSRDLGNVPHLDVRTFGEVAADVIRSEGGQLPDVIDVAWLSREGSTRLYDAIRGSGGRYDAVVVDEAQDIESVWWLPIHELLRDPINGILYVFGDDNQDLYNTDPSEIGIRMLVDLPRFEIAESRRLTRSLHAFADRFAHPLTGVTRSSARGPVGRPVEVVVYQTAVASDGPSSSAGHGCRSLLRTTLHRLVSREEIDPKDIVVLTPVDAIDSWLIGDHASPYVGSFHLLDDLTGGHCTRKGCDSRHVTGTTVHRFKGLESAVVVLAEIDARMDWHELLPLIYVGATRARTHLVVITDELTNSRLKLSEIAGNRTAGDVHETRSSRGE